MASPIEDYALLGDCKTAALVDKTGSIDWLCLPRFDSGACFAALVGSPENGYWKISPQIAFTTTRKYLEGTLVLETTFVTEKGACRLVDCLLLDQELPSMVRSIEGISGEVPVELALVIRFDYGSIVPWVRRFEGEQCGIYAVAGPERLTFSSPVPLTNCDLKTRAEFLVKSGEKYSFRMQWCSSFSEHPPHKEELPDVAVQRTVKAWRNWADRCEYRGPYRERVIRSLLTLKGLTYAPTGGIVAAPTTSLPEELGGNRNWDYRFCWLRDSTFTLYSLLNAGYREEAEKWRRWLVRAVAGTPNQTNIMYGVGGERRLPEMTLDWLSGYENSRPVRIGNAAYQQIQLDVFGEVMDTLDLARRSGLPHDSEAWNIQTEMVKTVAQLWAKPDEGIWEIRGPKRHFTYSKVMAWVAVDRAVKAVRESGFKGPVSEWTELRRQIKRDILENGFDPKLNSFVQYYGGKELDASLLLIGLVGFLPSDDPRLAGTVKAIQKNLMNGKLVSRYRVEGGVDGLAGAEGLFLACSFWLADNLFLLGEKEQAIELFTYLSSLANDVGLFAEEYSVPQRRMLGNFPQAFTHIAHINTAMNLHGVARPAIDRNSAGTR